MAQLADTAVSEAPSVADLLATAVEALGGTEREGQQDMAAAVERALRTGEHLAVQAGTGTGKSLAYLVPAIRHALEADQAVVVSTATIALQAQLVDRDLPRLTKALEPVLGQEPSFAILKGRGNYLCRHKIESGAQAEDPGDEQLFDPFQVSALGRQVTRLHEWAEKTKTGDRDELVPGVPDRAWRQVSVTARECLGASRCPVARGLLLRARPAQGGPGRRRRHQPRPPGHRRHRGPGGAARARRRRGRRGPQPRRPRHLRRDRRAHLRRGGRRRAALRASSSTRRCPTSCSTRPRGSTTCSPTRPSGGGRRCPSAVGRMLAAIRNAAWACRQALGPERDGKDRRRRRTMPTRPHAGSRPRSSRRSTTSRAACSPRSTARTRRRAPTSCGSPSAS